MADLRIAVEIPEFEGIDLADDFVSDLEDVLADVATEHGRQHLLGFGPSHDDAHTLDELAAQARAQFDKIGADTGANEFRERLVQTAAVAVGAVLSLHRRGLVTEDAAACDVVCADTLVDGLSALVELYQYPETYNGPEGDALADLLSEVASAVVDHHAAGFGSPSEPLSKALVSDEVTRIRYPVIAAKSPQEARRALVDGARRCVALVRRIDVHLAAAGADAPFAPYDGMPAYEPDGPYFGPRHDLPLKREGGSRD